MIETEKGLTKAEEEIMHVLWKLEKAFVKEIIEHLDGNPAYNTVSTIVRILEKKGFVEHEAFGRTHRYTPTISKKEYTKGFMKRFVKDYFGNSYKSMLSFFAEEENLSIKDLEFIKNKLEESNKKESD
jgi:predicted transcriptional regulator